MSENIQVIQAIKTFIDFHNAKAIRLKTIKEAGIKTPDFQVNYLGNKKFYCEIKSPELKINEKTNMFHWSTSITKLRDQIHKAFTQFESIEAVHISARVLIFTSNHMQLNWTNMLHAITGKVFYGNEIIADFNHLRRVKLTTKDIDGIDVFVWMQLGKDNNIYQIRIYINPISKFPKIKEVARVFEPTPSDYSFGK